MNLENLPIPGEFLDALGHHIFALQVAAEELEKRTPDSKQKWLEVLIQRGVTRYELSHPRDLEQAATEGLNALTVSVSDETSPPDASPQQL